MPVTPRGAALPENLLNCKNEEVSRETEKNPTKRKQHLSTPQQTKTYSSFLASAEGVGKGKLTLRAFPQEETVKHRRYSNMLSLLLLEDSMLDRFQTLRGDEEV